MSFCPSAGTNCPIAIVSDTAFRYFLGTTYVIFTILVSYEKGRQKMAEARIVPGVVPGPLGLPSEQRQRRRLIFDLGLFVIRMAGGVFFLGIMKVYNDADPDFLNAYPGRILVYGTHLYNVPIGYSLMIVIRHYKDEAFRNHLNRAVKSCFCP